MTSEELRRLADDELAAAGFLAVDAARLRAEAVVLEGALEPLLEISARVWTGPAAEDFEDRLRSHSRTLDEQVRSLQLIAAEFDVRAVELRKRATLMRTQAATAQPAVFMEMRSPLLLR